MENLKEFKGMKDDVQEIKIKYHNVINQKEALSKKYGILLGENEELTQLINSMKTELQTTSRSQCSWALEEEMALLREKLREVQVVNTRNEERALNFEKRAGEYQDKYGQLHETYSELQVECYKLQQKVDNLQVEEH